MAGVSARHLKNRIRSMESTRQLTKAMEMVASSRLRHAQAKIAASRPYFQILHETVHSIAQSSRDFRSPYLKPRQSGRTLFIVIAGDRGLAGGYNSSVLKLALAQMEGKEAAVLPIGKRSVDFFKSKKGNILTDAYAEADGMSIGDCLSIAKILAGRYLARDFDEISIIYTHFDDLLSQSASSLPLLPLTHHAAGEKKEDRSMPLFEPDPETVFAAIVPEYLGGILYGALCEARCSEYAARRTAMDSASRNADDMISGLRQTYNRARQAAITQEITEIVAGADA